MTIYLGNFGRLVEIHSTPTAEIEEEERASFSTSLEGNRTAHKSGVRRRVWSLSADLASPREQTELMAFANGEWGDGPFVFVSPDAPAMNLLSPQQSSCDPNEYGGMGSPPGRPPMLTPDGWVGRSVQNDVPAELLRFGYGHVPVLSGRKVTASAYVMGAEASVRVYFYDADRKQVGTFTSTVRATTGLVVRSYVTAVPPAGAVSCLVAGINCEQATRPSITWTDSMVDYADGQGCNKAVLYRIGRVIEAADTSNPLGTYSSLRFGIAEVG